MTLRTFTTVLMTLSIVAACERESRDFPRPAPAAEVGDLQTAAAMIAHDERNAYALAKGKKLWGWYNCSGCHANGGGGSGPALIDDVWTYGGDAISIFQTISNGRPNGMPAFGDRIPKEEIWALAAYVRSMAGLAPQDAAPNRDDAFLTRTPESFQDSQKPETATPSSASGPAQ